MLEIDNSCRDVIHAVLADQALYEGLLAGVLGKLRLELNVHAAPVYALTGRQKSLRSILEKLDRKGLELHELTDRIGVRITCLEVDHVRTITDQLTSVFRVEQVEETADRSDVSSFGYSALHCLARWNPDLGDPLAPPFVSLMQVVDTCVLRMRWRQLGVGKREEMESLLASLNKDAQERLFEIQVRTVLQDAWANVSHELTYKREADVPVATRRKLARIAAMLEETDEAFQTELRRATKRAPKDTLPDAEKSLLLTPAYLRAYAREMIGEEMSDDHVSTSLDLLQRMGVRTEGSFELLMLATLEALEQAFNSVLSQHLRSFNTMLWLLAYWTGVTESVFVQSQTENMDLSRGLVDEALFQKAVRRAGDLTQ